MSIFPANLVFKVVLSRKNQRDGRKLLGLLKNGTIIVYAYTNHVIARTRFTLQGPPGTLNIFATSFYQR